MSRGSRGPLASRFCTFHNNNYCVRDKAAHDIRKSFVLYLLKQKVNHAISHNESLRCIGFQLHDFLSDLSINKKFTKPVYFNGSQFFEEANFDSANFQELSFDNANFQARAFFRANFQETADFFGAKFQREADFLNAESQEEADFTDRKFEGEANFDSSEFNGRTHFSGYFNSKTEF